MGLKFYNAQSDELNSEQLKEELKASINELEKRLEEAKAFAAKLEADMLEHEDAFLAFSSVIANGYDRTGPDFVSAIDEDEDN